MLASARYFRPPFLLGLLLSALTLAGSGCRSEKVAFQFTPASSTASSMAEPRPPAALPAPAPAAAAVPSAELAGAPSAQPPLPARSARRLQRQLPRRLRATAAAGRPATATPPAGPAHPIERTFLWTGIGSVALGLLLTYIGGSSVPASVGLLSFAHVLLVLGGLLLAAWFVLLLLRASKE